jgi:hypothetical protein
LLRYSGCRCLRRQLHSLALIEQRVDHSLGNTLIAQVHNVVRAQVVNRAGILDILQNDVFADVGLAEFQHVLNTVGQLSCDDGCRTGNDWRWHCNFGRNTARVGNRFVCARRTREQCQKPGQQGQPEYFGGRFHKSNSHGLSAFSNDPRKSAGSQAVPNAADSGETNPVLPT